MKPNNKPVQIVITKHGVMMFKITTMSEYKTIHTKYVGMPIGAKTMDPNLLAELGQQMLKLRIARSWQL